jgi:single-stranded-DNA-specific exonuclease
VAFKFCHALLKYRRDKKDAAATEPDLRHYLDLVAVGTVADVVPLVDENRILVRHGLQRINKTDNLGLKALIAIAGVKQEIDCYHLGFVIGPRLNAVGRLASAHTALELLLTPDARRAGELAGELDVTNRERRQIEDEIRQEAEEEIDAYFKPDETSGIVSGRVGWHIGTVGIVASRLCGKYRRPAVVIGFDEDGHGRGSCRSIEELDIVDVLRGCAELLTAFGGHKMAAGLEIEKDRLEPFRKRFNDLCRDSLKGKDLRPVRNVDAWIQLQEADRRLCKAVQQLQPLGLGNLTPTFGVRAVKIVGQPKVVGNGHLKMQVARGGTQMDAIAFGMADAAVPDGDMDLLFQIQENTYMGRTAVQLNVKDFQATSAR